MSKKSTAEARLARLLKKVNDPEVFRRAVAHDDSMFESINRGHDDLVRRSRIAIAARVGR